MNSKTANIDVNKESLFRKIAKLIYKLSKSTLGLIITLYYAAKDPQTPKWAKSTILLALTYFILPLDSIPDFLPSLGYTDDITVLATAFATVASHITDSHKSKAQQTLDKFFRK